MNPTIIDIPGIGPAAVAALAEHRIKTVRALARASVQKIATVPGFTEARAARVKEEAAALLAEEETAPAGSESIPEEPRKQDKEKRGKKDKKDKKDKKKDKGKKQKKRKKDSEEKKK